MNNLNEFKEFYLKVVLPNTPSYKAYFNEYNIDKNFNELVETFKESYNITPFEINSSEIKALISQKKEPFYTYSLEKGSDVPQSILNKHYALFFDYNKQIVFSNLQDLINRLHELFGKSFIGNFQKQRINLNGNTRISSSSEIFGPVRDDYWTINKGSECELQYHIYKDGDEIGYGLGFNAQKSMNNLAPIENVSPFISSFFVNKTKIDDALKDYSFGHRNIQDLKNIKEGDFIFFGKRFEINLSANSFEIHGLCLLEMFYDLKNKQFDIYKLIFENSKNITTDTSQIFTMVEKESLLKYKKQIILQGPPGTGKTREAKEIAKNILGIEDLKNSEQFKLIQFHPSYTYEDFVRGIVAESKGDKLEYKSVNKVLGAFAELALNNYQKSRCVDNLISKRDWINEQFDNFVELVQTSIDNSGEYRLTDKVKIFDIDENAFYYTGDSWLENAKHRMKFVDIKEAFLSNPNDKKEFRALSNITGSAKQHYGYYYKIFSDFKTSITENYEEVSPSIIEAKDYVLIIDEINRSNLSSVLGELIYALEYRGQEIESIYTVEDSLLKNKFILPPNLYIIGTMNTADRSVGHIDYAIRRRFAFVDVLPQALKETNEIYFNTTDFEKVASIFINANVNSEFEIKDVQIGHSYFIAKKREARNAVEAKEIFDMKMKYEVIPLLNEYLKDGVLNQSALSKINDLKATYASS
ncbi:AAA family ATPase [Chryseobacterium capnotolerans]|uniref:McrB family protein n=1 Tax=Chryseobacterium TaxID=59732 RepID=UPI00083AFB20|nr:MULTISPECIES: AAA family ATPase [Chryseobacterium]UHO39894.1 AAA family ATPase [Chryseobacterium capnotolerans]